MQRWIATLAGPLDLDEPKPEQIETDAFCEVLAGIPRFNRHTIRPYSVAEHSLLVRQILHQLEPGNYTLALAGLLHDGHEYATGDIIAPVQWILGAEAQQQIKRLQRRIDEAICRKYGLPLETLDDPRIHEADMVARATEARDLLVHQGAGREWHGLPDPLPGKIQRLGNEAVVKRLFRRELVFLAGRVQLEQSTGGTDA